VVIGYLLQRPYQCAILNLFLTGMAFTLISLGFRNDLITAVRASSSVHPRLSSSISHFPILKPIVPLMVVSVLNCQRSKISGLPLFVGLDCLAGNSPGEPQADRVNCQFISYIQLCL